MRTIVYPALRGLSFVAALATVGLWARSHFVIDRYIWPVRSASNTLVDSRELFTTPGRLVFHERTLFM